MMYIATKTGIDAAKTPSEIVFQKTAEAIADLTGNKIAGKITLAGKSESKPKKKKKDNEANEIQEIYIPPEKQQIIGDLRFC